MLVWFPEHALACLTSLWEFSLKICKNMKYLSLVELNKTLERKRLHTDVSLLMKSRRLLTLLLASSKSCLISTGPMSLYTFATFSRFSSSCVKQSIHNNADSIAMRTRRSEQGWLDSKKYKTLKTSAFSLYCCTNCCRLFMHRLRSIVPAKNVSIKE